MGPFPRVQTSLFLSLAVCSTEQVKAKLILMILANGAGPCFPPTQGWESGNSLLCSMAGIVLSLAKLALSFQGCWILPKVREERLAEINMGDLYADVRFQISFPRCLRAWSEAL